MVQCFLKNNKVNRTFSIFLQIVFIFTFLTLFFFLYVHKVENQSFKDQMNLVVDDLMTDVNIQDINKLLPSKMDNDIKIVLIDGVLDYGKRKTYTQTKDDDDKVIKNNKKIFNNALKILGIMIGFAIFVGLVLYFTGFCIPFKIHIKEVILAVFVIGMTEYLFLTIITRSYLTADPSDVRHELGESIKKYIKNRKKL